MSETPKLQYPEWHFFDGGPSTPRYGGDPTKHAVEHDTETFIREVLQNANDQRLDGGLPVEVRIKLKELTGDELDSFLQGLCWESGLSERIHSVANGPRGRGFGQFLANLEEDEEPSVRLVVIEDRNTTGLTGTWNEDSNYAALVRDELYSSKQDDTAGGSYGLGKSVLWTFSGISTVLFNSRPVERAEGRDPPRFIGRTKLPTHQVPNDDREYQGAGWFCNPVHTDDGIQPWSVWGDAAADLADQLHCSRADVTGTSAMIVGFRDPTRDYRPSLDELADEFTDAAVKYFWPAIHRDDLEVSVETPNGVQHANLEDSPEIRPFVEAYADRYSDRDELEAPGDVVGRDINVRLPDNGDGTPTEDGPVRLAARLASPADDPTYRNRVALFRGAGMVVKYFDQSRVAFGDRNFYGVLAAGTARSTGAPRRSDRAIERFLRYAEPPDHDDWESTENLKKHYKQGYRMALDDLTAEIREGLRNIVSRNTGGNRELSENVLDKFPIHGTGRRSTSRSVPKVVELEGESRFEDQRWKFSGSAEPTIEDYSEWTVDITLRGLGEDGTTHDTISVEHVEVKPEDVDIQYESGIAKLRISDEIGRVEFNGVSTRVERSDFSEGTVGETRLEVDAELRYGGDGE